MTTDTVPSTNNNTLSKREYWQRHMVEWEKSDLTQEAYCAQAGIKYGSFGYWRGVLLGAIKQQNNPHFLPVKIAMNKPVSQDSPPRAIQIKLLSGHNVYLPISMKIEDINCILAALGDAHA